jgi:hypothetical protein
MNTNISINISICIPFCMDVEMIKNIKFKLSMESLCVLNYLLNCAYDLSTFMIGVDMCVYFILIHFHIKVEMYNMDFNSKNYSLPIINEGLSLCDHSYEYMMDHILSCF